MSRSRARLAGWVERNAYGPGAAGLFVRLGLTGLMLTPFLAVALFGYLYIRDDLTGKALSRHQAVAELVAGNLKEKLDRIVDVGISLASRKQFRTLVEKGEWDGAMAIMEGVTRDFPYIDRLFLADPAGTEMADLPPLEGAVGKNFSHRDWYKGVVRDWVPHVSGAYERFAEPKMNVVAAAFPILGSTGKPAGILVIQVPLRYFHDLSRAMADDSQGVIYIVDSTGAAISHPDHPPEGRIVDMTGAEEVRRALGGEEGSALLETGSAARVAGYSPVARYGWVAVSEEPAAAAFAVRDRTLRWVLFGYALLFGMNCLVIHLFFKTAIGRVRLAEALQAANQELEAFSYSVSHDLRAPLRAIDGFSKILEEDHARQLDSEARRLLGVVRSNTQQMGALIDDLLAFSRLSRKEMETVRVDMMALARAALSEQQALPGAPTPKVTIHDVPPARGDPTLLRQVWVNLISNALKYSKDKPDAAVAIGSKLDGRTTVYYVQDNGVGFDMKYAGKLFGVFQRLHSSEEFEGTGVGLAIVQRVIHRHGGKVWAEAEPGKGAKFHFTVPGETPR